jgi:hypothetical protein
LAGWTSGSMTEAKQRIVGELMRIDGLRAAANYDWQTIKTSIRIDGELSATGAPGRRGVQGLVPQGPGDHGRRDFLLVPSRSRPELTRYPCHTPRTWR